MSIYKGNTKVTGTGVQVDTSLSSTSTYAVTNMAITEALAEVGYDEWQKPADWIDIRSGALDNSIYLLVAHSTPTESGGVYSIATYPKFIFHAGISNYHTYDVYVDGFKLYTTESGSDTTIDFEALYTNGTLVGGYDVAYPSALVTHVIRITPTNASDTIVSYANGSLATTGLLWMHLALTNAISLTTAFSNATNDNRKSTLLEAITAINNEVKMATEPNALCRNANIKTLPTIDLNNHYVGRNAFQHYNAPILRLKNIKQDNPGSTSLAHQFAAASSMREIDTNGEALWVDTYMFSGCNNLKKLPPLKWARTDETVINNFVTNCSSLNDTVIDAKDFKTATRLVLNYDSTTPAPGIKGLIVSNEALFTGSAPQIRLNNTGLSRAALVNLFKSMPYNVGYTAVGSPTITDGVVSNLSSDDYVQSDTVFPYTANMSLEVQVKYDVTALGRIFRLGTGSQTAFNIRSLDNYITFYTLNAAYKSNLVATDYKYLRVICPNLSQSNVTIQASNDGVSWTTGTLSTVSTTQTTPGSTVHAVFGRGSVEGSIDLNETYIKINGVLWFRGTASMTKTVSVVGCPGTTDLTTADKAIAEDKGWAITIS